MRLLVPCLLLVASWTAFAEPREGCAELRKTARFTVYFERVELEKLIQTISDATCRSFIVGENVKGKISIVGPENGKLMLDADQFYSAFLAALDANGLAAVQQGRFMRIIDKPNARRFPVPLVKEGDVFPVSNEIVTRIFRLKNAELEPMRAVVTSFLSQGGEMIPVAPDVLIVTDLAANQQRIASLLETLDVAKPPTEVTKLVSIKHAAADELLDKVTRVLTAKPGQKPGEALTSVADERTNRVLLSGPPALVERAQTLLEELDVAVAGDSRARVYRLKNADAKDIAATLEAMTNGGGAKKGPVLPGQAVGATSGEVRISVSEATTGRSKTSSVSWINRCARCSSRR
jgi:general secretion pathway protein D